MIYLEKSKLLDYNKDREESSYKSINLKYLNLKAKLLDLYNNIYLFYLIKNKNNNKYLLINYSLINKDILDRVNTIE